MKVILYLFLLTPLLLSGQKLEPEAISSAGDHFEVAELKLDWTLGENAVETIGTDENRLTQGFQQGILKPTTSIIVINPELAINAFPNPTSQILILEKPNVENYEIWMTDMEGRLLLSQQLKNRQTEINLSDLTSGMYLIAVINRKSIIQWIKIEKI